jgi:diguanylate cyclase (GGDEF)-like protein
MQINWGQAGMTGRPHRAARWTLTLIVVGCLAGAAVILTARAVMAPIDAHTTNLERRTIPADRALQATSDAARTGQAAFIAALDAPNATAQGAAINDAQQAGRRQDTNWATYLRLAYHNTGERALQDANRAAVAHTQVLAAALIGANRSDPTYAANLAAERSSADLGIGLIEQLQARFYDPVIQSNTATVASDVSSGRVAILIASAFAFVAYLVVGAVAWRRVWRDERAAAANARGRAAEARRTDIETRLQRALEMESSEEGTFNVVRQGLLTVAEGRAVELLVADSPQAHFHQVLSTVGDGVGACRVAAPGECPAARSGQTRTFEDSALLDTCPYLRDHGERVWASCVPVSIAGHTTGVLHAECPVDAPPATEFTSELELVARKAGDRIGVLRVLARTEAQAQVDPLTGLPNRRTLESRAHDLLEHDTEFVVAYADLDHFKDLNDLHGHDTGDRALRLFARVLRDSIRPRDVPARYGGEEFVVVLPNCSIADARDVAERVRSQLAAALDTSNVPSFTVSVGLASADADADEALSEVIDRADAALFTAKQLGRDRIVAAGDRGETVPSPTGTIAAPDAPAHN